ncbi:MAG: NAD(P)/FAD-dependent oxidoreductase [Candidatus Peribacteraceae bacterium]|nr:NAD(P)/FAD-dependent oxidoreductase [Candidatus Peribacteraceae bacterium]MDD5742777.1 NAD(P)/FAD-dependent oxidoreductase [Candidatus Peribacteraceae bacterium]
MSRRVAIIAGAGPAGLTAAYELLKRTDIRPIVCEATDVIGGIAQTYNYKGNRIDLGGHRFFSKSKRIMQWWFNILPLQGKPSADTAEKKHEIDYAAEAVVDFLCPACADAGSKRPAPDPEREDRVMLQRPRLSRIYHRRNFFPYPISITLGVAFRLGIINTLLIGLSYLKARAFKRKDETYLDAFFINRFGRRLYETFFRDYTEKVWGIPCSQIRADWGAQRVQGLSLRRAVVHAVKDLLSSDFKKAQQERETTLITRFYYPKYGPGQMWETVAAQVSACGGEVRMRTRVSGVHLTDGRVTSVTLENTQTGAEETLPCDFFFSSMPIKHLAGMMTPHPPSSVVEVAEGLPYRDFITIGLLLKKLHVQDGRHVDAAVPDNWIYIQESGVKVGRVQIFNNWSPYLVKDRKNTMWIGLEYFVNEGGDLWVKPDQELISFGIAEMEKIHFLKKEDVLDACVLRIPKAYPAYFGSYNQLHVVREFVQNIPNLYLIGRNGMHRYNNQDHSMLTSMTAVDNIVAGRTDSSNIWEVNLEMVYHETKT